MRSGDVRKILIVDDEEAICSLLKLQGPVDALDAGLVPLRAGLPG